MQPTRMRVYVWEFPVRFSHWINALCVFALSITGFYIGSPFIHAISTKQFIMGWMRFIHFVFAYVFLMSIILRLYWSFASDNKHSSWRVFFPFTARQRTDLVDSLKFYTLMSKKPPFAVGHTASAGFAYFLVLMLFFFEIGSGFALYGLSHMKSTILWLLGGWMLGIMDAQTLRLWHNLVMYVILSFVVLHIYMAWWLDTVEKNGMMGSIFGGYKFVTGKEWE